MKYLCKTTCLLVSFKFNLGLAQGPIMNQWSEIFKTGKKQTNKQAWTRNLFYEEHWSKDCQHTADGGGDDSQLSREEGCHLPSKTGYWLAVSWAYIRGWEALFTLKYSLSAWWSVVMFEERVVESES